MSLAVDGAPVGHWTYDANGNRLTAQGADTTRYEYDCRATLRLLQVLDDLVERGDTVVLVEHNLDVIRCCDWLVDLGPDGGDRGGELVAEGAPEVIAEAERSHTGRFLREMGVAAGVR